MKKSLGIKEVIFFVIFVALVFIGSKINFSPLVGAENQFFTLFQFFGPIAGGFLGSIFGPLAVLIAQLVNFLSKDVNLVNILRLAPMVVAAWYFSSFPRRKEGWKLTSALIPIVAIIAFVVHPVGRQVWFFSLLWTIPLIAMWLPGRLLSRSVGATFTAHAVGGALWIWTIPMPAEAWVALIPVVLMERLLFAGGIAISYIVMNIMLDKLAAVVPEFVKVDKKYISFKSIFA